MTRNDYGEIICTKEEYTILKELLEDEGVNLRWSVTDTKIYQCYIRNNYKTAVEGWGDAITREQAEKFFERDKK